MEKGIWGESVVNMMTTVHLDKEKYHLVGNVTLSTESGTTQIDHIIVSQYGIFVVDFETSVISNMYCQLSWDTFFTISK
jgi:hypothetical protein